MTESGCPPGSSEWRGYVQMGPQGARTGSPCPSLSREGAAKCWGPAKPSPRLRSLLSCNLRCQPSIIKKCSEFEQRTTVPFIGGGWPHPKLGIKPRLRSRETGMKSSSPSLCITSVIASELPSSLYGSRPSGFSCSKTYCPVVWKPPIRFSAKSSKLTQPQKNSKFKCLPDYAEVVSLNSLCFWLLRATGFMCKYALGIKIRQLNHLLTRIIQCKWGMWADT